MNSFCAIHLLLVAVDFEDRVLRCCVTILPHGGNESSFHFIRRADLSDHGSVDVHYDDLAVCRAKKYEFVIRSPDAAGDVSEFQIEHRRPVTLSSNGTDQNETVPLEKWAEKHR